MAVASLVTRSLPTSNFTMSDLKPGLLNNLKDKIKIWKTTIMKMSSSFFFLPFSRKPRLQVLEISDIEKEFQLVCARLKLANKVDDLTGPTFSPTETVALLVSANLFADAVNLARCFDLDPRNIVEGLAGRCVRLARARPSEQEAAWEWLAEYTNIGAKGQTGWCF